MFQLKKYLPELQERLRKQGFPRYKEGILQTLSLDPETFAPKVERSPRFEFYDKLAKTGVLLAPDAITIHTNDYTTFEDFDRVVRGAVATIKDVAEVELAERVGLRYVDWIRATSEVELSHLVKPGLRGLDESELGAKQAFRNFHMTCVSSIGNLLIRFYQQRGVFLPVDLGPVNLQYDLKVDPSETISLLDLDHSSEQPFDLTDTAVSELAWRLHDTLDLAFRTAVTPEALRFWGADNG